MNMIRTVQFFFFNYKVDVNIRLIYNEKKYLYQ